MLVNELLFLWSTLLLIANCKMCGDRKSVIRLSHLPRFDHDCNRGHHREGIGIIVTDLIRSYLILISIVAIGLIVIKFLTAKNFPRLSRLINQSCSSHQIVIHRIKSQQIESTRAPQSRLSQRIVDKESATM